MNSLFLLVLLPLAFACIITLVGKRLKNFPEAVTIAVTLFLSCTSLYLLKMLDAAGSVIVYKVGGWLPPLGICLVADGLSVFMLLVVNTVALPVAIYAWSYMKIYTAKSKFYALFLLLLGGLNGVIVSGDLFNLYVFIELTSITAYILVAFGINAEDLEASFKYAIMGAVASLFILLGIAFLYGYTSTLMMADISFVLSARPNTVLVGFVSVLFLTGFGLKAAVVPFHSWLADAHSSAPSPVSAMLSGIVIKTIGIYALTRVFFNVLGAQQNILFVLMVLGTASMVIGAFLAITQNDIKRMLAYSSVSQVGYIVFALGVGTPLAILGGIFHLLNHAFFKSLLFLNAGAIERAVGTRELNKMGGLNSRLPVTGLTSLVGAMGISGVPPFGGFWSKLIIIIAAVASGHLVFALIAALVSIITLAYYLKFQTLAFFGVARKKQPEIKEVSFTMKSSMVALAIVCIVSGVLLTPRCSHFLNQATHVVAAGMGYRDAVLRAVK